MNREFEEASPFIRAIRVCNVANGLTGFLFKIKVFGAFQPAFELGHNLPVKRAFIDHYPVIEVSRQVGEKMVERSVPVAHLVQKALVSAIPAPACCCPE